MSGRREQMLPGWPGAGRGEPAAASELRELADAVREHEEITTRRTVPKRPADHELYRRLAEIEARGGERRNGALT